MKKPSRTSLPFMEAEKQRLGTARANGKVLLATVKGDVHDISKNIVGSSWGATTTKSSIWAMVSCRDHSRDGAGEAGGCGRS